MIKPSIYVCAVILASVPVLAQKPAHSAEVQASETKPATDVKVGRDGKFTLSAHGADINEVLRDVASAANVKLAGSTPSQPVFGNYGPSTLSEIVHILLDGTGTNMSLNAGNANKQGEITLTTKNGGPTPPSAYSAISAAQTSQATDGHGTPSKVAFSSGTAMTVSTEPSSEGSAQPVQPAPFVPPTADQIQQKIKQLQAAQHGRQ